MSDIPASLNAPAPSRPVAEKPTSERATRFRLGRFAPLILTVQAILFLSNLFLYETWMAFHPALSATAHNALLVAFLVAAFSFVAASLLAWRYFNAAVRAFYTISAVWVGLMTFGLFAACACWIALGFVRIAGLNVAPETIADVLFGAALAVGVYGLINAAWVRVHRVTVKLPNLPEQWRGRTAALVSDLHLGHVRNAGFVRRIVTRLNGLRPDLVLIAGDMYDGTVIDAAAAAEPWSALETRFGALFVTGNHDEFTNRNAYLDAVAGAGIRVLNNEKIELDGLQIIGVHDREVADPEGYRAILRKAAIARDRASVLVVHVPHRLPIAEEAGISLQVSGHTHGGQFPPGSWVASRIYGSYVHGLHAFGKLLVLTNWGAGTWGPPLRVGTQAEIVVIEFQPA